MEIKVISSGSRAGNCYYVSDGETKLLLDAGIPFPKIQAALDYDTASVAAILLTHEHGDHSAGIAKAVTRGTDVFMSAGTADALKLCGHRLRITADKKSFTAGTFDCTAFRTVHDCAEPLGFTAASRVTGEKVLYATDTCYLPYRFRGVTHWIIECNYDNESLAESTESGLITKELAGRIRRTHMGLDTLLKTFAVNDMSTARKIYIAHLSENNARADYIRERVRAATGAEVV